MLEKFAFSELFRGGGGRTFKITPRAPTDPEKAIQKI